MGLAAGGGMAPGEKTEEIFCKTARLLRGWLPQYATVWQQTPRTA